jgi:RNA ligase (TIGR02306 family)
MERKLATVRRIKEILPIEGADRIELAVVDGWKVVVAKDVQHKVGDLVIYCEIDSFLPIREEFEFLRKSSYKKMGDQEGFRLRTAKMKGQISQGLILPIFVLNPPDTNIYVQPFEGLDVTEMLDIVKYEPPIPANLAGKVKGLFPSFLIKTDEERVQNIAVEYSALCFQSKHQFYVTEKLDGSSATFYINNGEFGVCSRNLELLETEDNSFWKVARELKLEENLRALGKNICLQGELIGEGIQGNPYGIKGQTIRFFSVYQIDSRTRLGIKDLKDICFMIGLQTVPILESNFLLPNTIEEMLQYAEGKSALNPKTEREGVVVRSLDGTISFKAISNKFLLKNEQ